MENLNELKPVGKLSPFAHFCCTIGNLPTSYMISLTYEEQLLWLCNYLEKTVIPAVNTNAEAVAELQNLYIQLKEYVDNYFTNLDVQEEINNKLDEMANSGELVDIIASYLEVNSLLCFNTLNDLKNADNLIDGSFTRIFGKLTYNDGYGNLYKIRALVNTDVIDDDNIVALTNYPTLVAEKINNTIINNLQNDINNINNNIEDINTNINNINNNLDKKQNLLDKLVVFGDSWSDTNVTDSIWSTNVASELNLTLHNYAVNGAGFVAPSNNLISSQITTFSNSNVDKTRVKFIVLAGGINDYRNNIRFEDTAKAISNAIANLKNLCPQAKIIYVSNCQYPYTRAQSYYWVSLHNYLSTSHQISTYNMDGTFGKPLFNNNNYYHLTRNGQLLWGRNIVATLTGGEIINYRCQEKFEDSEIKLLYSTQRIKDMIFINLTIIPKTNLNNKSISFSSPRFILFRYRYYWYCW